MELKRLEDLDVIHQVRTPTDWCAPIAVVPKENKDAIRLCVDLTKLDESVMRENCPLPSTDQLLAQIAAATVFTNLDCNRGFHQVPLGDDSQELTTFITPFWTFLFQATAVRNFFRSRSVSSHHVTAAFQHSCGHL